MGPLVCECPNDCTRHVTVNGMCLRCFRKPLDLIEANLARYEAMLRE